MFIVILIYDQLLFRPLVAWAEKFKSEQQAADKTAESWVINLFRRTRLMRNLGRLLARYFDAFVNIKVLRTKHVLVSSESVKHFNERWIDYIWNGAIFILGVSAFAFIVNYIINQVSLAEVGYVFYLGMVTVLRVFILIIVCSLIWVPIGIVIGLNPRTAQIAQPIAQILAAFPANLLYPFIVVFIVRYHLSANIWLTPLMILGAQWYILFNVIAGASTIPKDLLQVVDNLSVTGRLRWARLLLPCVFPYYVTGAITAAGGAWNASIVAEVASWGNEKLVATGLGAYITQYTEAGDFYRIALGIGVMCLIVLFVNRLLWRPLYSYAVNRFSLE